MFVIRFGRTPIIGEQQTDVEGFTCKILTLAPQPLAPSIGLE